MEAESRTCQNCKQEFRIEPEDFDFYKKIDVPPPTWCPDCRFVRRAMLRNDRFIFRRKDAHSGKEILSTVPPGAEVVTYDKDYWFSDDWDQQASGMEYDWNKPFFEQFKTLFKIAPIPAKVTMRAVDSEYSMNASDIKNCYMVFGAVEMEDSAYCDTATRSKNCIDCSFILSSQLCYECVLCRGCYRCFFSDWCEDSQDLILCRDCVSSSDCFGCVGLRGKQYHIWNKPYTREDYFAKLKEMGINSRLNLRKLSSEVADFWLKYPVRYLRSFRNQDSAGEYITNSKNVKDSYYIDGGENIRFCNSLYASPSKDCYDHHRYGANSELVYECSATGGHASSIKFGYLVNNNVRDIQYSVYCTGSHNLFGCVGLHNQEYCILNKKYSKEEYEALVPRIIAHMNEVPYTDKRGRVYKYGEYFPTDMSYLAYNDTPAQEHFPLTKEKALELGYSWRDPEVRDYKVSITSSDLPQDIEGVEDTILGAVIECEDKAQCGHKCTTAFRIIPQELSFHRQMSLPLPSKCPNCRQEERLDHRNKPRLWDRQCQCAGVASANGVYKNTVNHPPHGKESACTNIFKTSYSPDRPEIVYCEQCYQAETV